MEVYLEYLNFFRHGVHNKMRKTSSTAELRPHIMTQNENNSKNDIESDVKGKSVEGC